MRKLYRQLRKKKEKAREKGKIFPTERRVPENSKEREESLLK